LDTSALVKRYIQEPGSLDLRVQFEKADMQATAQITFVEAIAALAKAVRTGNIARKNASQIMVILQQEWANLQNIEISDELVNQAAMLAWQHDLRGYDAVHLASALAWQARFGEPITMTTYDLQLWTIAQQVGLAVYPLDLPALLATW